MREDRKAHGVRHAPECRRRIEQSARDASDPRITRMDTRHTSFDQRLARHVAREYAPEPQDPTVHQEGGVTVSVSASAEQEKREQTTPQTFETPYVHLEAPQDATNAEPQGDDMDIQELHSQEASIELNLLEDRESIKSMFEQNPKVNIEEWTDTEIEEAIRLYELFLVHGVEQNVAKQKVVELYSPPRVTEHIKGICGQTLQTGSTFDIRPGRDGRGWDLSKQEVRAQVRRKIQAEKPYIVIGSPPCTDFCVLQRAWNLPRMKPEEVQRRIVSAKVHLDFCAEIYA